MSSSVCQDPNRSLKEALLEALECILSPDQEVRKAAEERAIVLEVTEEYGLQLLDVMMVPAYDIALRQLACVLFNRYIESYWMQNQNHANSDQEPGIRDHLKEKIKQILPLGLKEPIKKIRNSIAHSLFIVACYDWPNQWPNLFDTLLVNLTSGDEFAVQGSIRVIKQMCAKMEYSICDVSPLILREMHEIVRNEERFSSTIRSKAIEVFVSCATIVINEVKIRKHPPLKQLIDQILPNFYETLVKILLLPDNTSIDIRMKIQVIKALTTFMSGCHKKVIGWLPHLLPAVWQTLTFVAFEYSATVITSVEEDCRSVDSDGEVIELETLIFGIFDFVTCLIESPKSSSTVLHSLPDLLYYVIFYSQITADQSNRWSNDPNEYVDDELTETFEYTVRLSAQELVSGICYECKDSCVDALTQAISRHLQEASTKKMEGDSNWWRIYEACMLTLGNMDRVLLNSSGNPICDVESFVQNVVMPYMTGEGHIFLLGRCLLFGSRYVSLLSNEMNLQFIHACVNALHDTQHPCVRISAARSLETYCLHFTKAKNMQILLPFLPSMTDSLLTLATVFSFPVMRLVFETLVAILSMNEDFTLSVESKIVPFTISVFLKYNHDPVVIMHVENVFKTLSMNPQCNTLLQQRLLPTIVTILNAPEDKVSTGLLSVTLDILQNVVRYSQRPLNNILMNNVFPAVVQCVLHTEECSVLQSGGECLRAYISVSTDQIFNYQDNDGHSGLSLIFQVLAQLLNPFGTDVSALHVGRLAITLVTKAGSYLGENLDHLLRAVLSKMQCTQTNCVIQSLILVYAHLIHNQLDAVINFLSTVPGPTGESALKFVLTEWCSRQHLFGICYMGKVCLIALSKLLLYGISSQDTRLSDIRVCSDEMGIDEANGLKIHNSFDSNPTGWLYVPLFVKILKLILSALNSCLSVAKARSEIGETNNIVEIEDSLYDYDTDDDFSDTSSYDMEYAFAGKVPQIWGDDDPDFLEDPIYHINLCKYLTDLCHSLKQQPWFSSFIIHLTPKECGILAKIGIDVKVE